MDKEFDLGKVMTLQAGKWFVIWGSLVIVTFFGIKVYLGDELGFFTFPTNLFLALFFFGLGIGAINRIYSKHIKIRKKGESIIIRYDDQEIISSLISNLKFIRTLHGSNTKGDIQAELFFTNRKISLHSALNIPGKKAWDNLCSTLVKEFKFKERVVPFSIWTHNLQGIKYVEYNNPEYKN